MKDLKIGMIGLDTSHSIAFTRLLNDTSDPHWVEGGKVVIAYPGGSEDFELSWSRVKGFTKEMKTRFGVKIADSVVQVAAESDAILLESADGRKHFEQLGSIVSCQKPIFIDKPFCLSSQEAYEMQQLSLTYQTPIFSCSALRFAQNLTQILSQQDTGRAAGADCFGPLEFVDTQPGYFWYGIHTIEMLFAILGRDVHSVQVFESEDHDFLMARWRDGRIGTIRGDKKGKLPFCASIHFESGHKYVNASQSHTPYYASLLQQIIGFFQDHIPRVPVNETIEIIRFIEAANKSKSTGKAVQLG
ncbi:predicted dehydrogenase [Bacillus oleivorans]|uniref:Predicted dehydrogenase n=1 Tax=Bacillus oleivorans TaxID=1448271 RepID=A0A285D0J2_9BACI|nr:oxidoreductase [Bacillus oleivorans]SNX72703.1 predicted dehydrogenase [Bacillus oleivorans]